MGDHTAPLLRCVPHGMDDASDAEGDASSSFCPRTPEVVYGGLQRACPVDQKQAAGWAALSQVKNCLIGSVHAKKQLVDLGLIEKLKEIFATTLATQFEE